MRGKIAVAAPHKIHHPVGAGHAPPATVCYNEYNGLACRHGYYAARCNHPDITIYRVNPTGRSRPSPTNLPGIGSLPIIAYLPVIRREGSRPLLAALPIVRYNVRTRHSARFNALRAASGAARSRHAPYITTRKRAFNSAQSLVQHKTKAPYRDTVGGFCFMGREGFEPPLKRL